jgi:hypothetical protein
MGGDAACRWGAVQRDRPHRWLCELDAGSCPQVTSVRTTWTNLSHQIWGTSAKFRVIVAAIGRTVEKAGGVAKATVITRVEPTPRIACSGRGRHGSWYARRGWRGPRNAARLLVVIAAIVVSSAIGVAITRFFAVRHVPTSPNTRDTVVAYEAELAGHRHRQQQNEPHEGGSLTASHSSFCLTMRPTAGTFYTQPCELNPALRPEPGSACFAPRLAPTPPRQPQPTGRRRTTPKQLFFFRRLIPLMGICEAYTISNKSQ